MKSIYDIIRKPIITEKSMRNVENLLYTFEVLPKATKTQIKHAIEKIFNVNVVEIRTIKVHRKARRVSKYEGFRPAYKKAIVRLRPGQTIDVFEV